MAKMAVNGWTWLNMAANNWKWLERAGIGWIGLKWLEMAVIAGNMEQYYHYEHYEHYNQYEHYKHYEHLIQVQIDFKAMVWFVPLSMPIQLELIALY